MRNPVSPSTVVPPLLPVEGAGASNIPLKFAGTSISKLARPPSGRHAFFTTLCTMVLPW